MAIFLFIVILVVLILVHEFGHFAAAKLLGVGVEEFAIGFPPRLLTLRHKETDYTFNLLLFGGFVRLVQEYPGTEPASANGLANKPVWTQIIVILAGVAMNILLAWIIFITVFMVGIHTDASAAVPGYFSNPQTTVVAIAPNSPAQSMHIMPGDVVAGAQSEGALLQPPFSSADFQRFTAAHAGNDITLSLMRSGKPVSVTVHPAEGIVEGRAAIGVQLADIGTERLPLTLAVTEGSKSFWSATALTAEGLGGFFLNLIRGHENFSDVSGPVGIAQAGVASIGQGMSAALLFMAIISINLAIINLLPVPGLDGGRLLFIIIEKIKGSALSPALATKITIAGFALLALLMILVTYHDLTRII